MRQFQQYIKWGSSAGQYEMHARPHGSLSFQFQILSLLFSQSNKQQLECKDTSAFQLNYARQNIHTIPDCVRVGAEVAIELVQHGTTRPTKNQARPWPTRSMNFRHAMPASAGSGPAQPLGTGTSHVGLPTGQSFFQMIFLKYNVYMKYEYIYI